MINAGDIQAIAGIAGLLLGITYIIGGLIVSVYLSRYGVSDYQVVRIKYLVVGLTYLANAVSILILSAIPAFFAISLETIYQQSLLIVSLLTSIFLLWIWSRPYHHKASFLQFYAWRVWVTLGAISMIFPLMVTLRQSFTSQIDFYSGLLLIEAILAGVISTLGQVYYYARYVYADNRTFLGAADPIGSGAPVAVQLTGNEENIIHLFHLGVSIVQPGLTEKVLLLDETETHYIIGVTRDQETRAIKVTKDVVKAILYLG